MLNQSDRKPKEEGNANKPDARAAASRRVIRNVGYHEIRDTNGQAKTKINCCGKDREETTATGIHDNLH